LQSTYNQTALIIVKIKFLASDKIRIITYNLHLNCAKCGLQNDLFHLTEYVLNLWYTKILLESL